jgi:hypothetical protein
VIAPGELFEREAWDEGPPPNLPSGDFSSCDEVVKHAKTDAKCTSGFRPTYKQWPDIGGNL